MKKRIVVQWVKEEQFGYGMWQNDGPTCLRAGLAGIHPGERTTMQVKPGLEAKYADYKTKNSDPYGAGVVNYETRWVNAMEAEISKGRTVAECAKDTASAADTDGITGFMYGCAVSSLSHFWVHGEELRRWHNLDCQLGDEGEKANASGGALNPALLSIGA